MNHDLGNIAHVPSNPTIANALFRTIAEFEKAFPDAPKVQPDPELVSHIGQGVRNSWYTRWNGVGIRFFPYSYHPEGNQHSILLDIFIEEKSGVLHRFGVSLNSLLIDSASWWRAVVTAAAYLGP